MTIKDILKIEENHTEKNFDKIFLIKDGENSTWYSAYEWSACLAEFYYNGLDENKRLNASKKKYKDSEVPIVKVGMPLTSFAKYFPEYKAENVSESIIEISVDLTKYSNFPKDKDNKQILQGWKETLPLKDDKKPKRQPINHAKENVYNRPQNMLSIFAKIIKYNTENKSTEDIAGFFKMIKEDCLDILL